MTDELSIEPGQILLRASHGTVGEAVAYMRMPLTLSSLEAMNRFIEEAYGKGCLCTEEPKGWLKVTTGSADGSG